MNDHNDKSIRDLLINAGVEVAPEEPTSSYQNMYRTFETAMDLFNWLTEDDGGDSIRQLIGSVINTGDLPFEEWYIIQDNVSRLPDGSYLYIWL